jgi:hypothetical protein
MSEMISLPPCLLPSTLLLGCAPAISKVVAWAEVLDSRLHSICRSSSRQATWRQQGQALRAPKLGLESTCSAASQPYSTEMASVNVYPGLEGAVG